MVLIFCSHIGFAQFWDPNGNYVAPGKNKLGSLNDESVVFISNDSARMRLTNTGYFGINTTLPTTYFDVNGQIRLRFNAINNGVLTSDANGNATWNLLNLNLSGDTLSIQNQGNKIDLSPYLDNTDSQVLDLEGTTLSISNGNSVHFNGWDTDTLNELQNLSINGNMLDISLGNSVSLDDLNYWSKLNDNLYYNNGSVGIGISAPNKLLHLHSESTYSLAAEISTEHSAISLSSLKAKPLKPIIREGSESTLLLTNKYSGSEATDGLLIRSYNNNATISLQEEGSLSLITKNALRFKMESNGNVSIGRTTKNYFTVNENGNVGIGTDEPGAKLDIDGTVRIQNGWRGLKIEGQGANPHRYDFIVGDLGGNSNNSGGFSIFDATAGGNGEYRFAISKDGNVGIGTISPQYKLDVAGEGHFYKVRVKAPLNWPDYVFDNAYELPNLTDLEQFIKQNKHLPGIPNEAEVLENGIDLGEMNKKLLEKVEELTLIIIEQDKTLNDQHERLSKLEEQIKN